MKSDYDFKHVDIRKRLIKHWQTLILEKQKKSKTDYDLVGQMPEKIQKRYFDTIKNK